MRIFRLVAFSISALFLQTLFAATSPLAETAALPGTRSVQEFRPMTDAERATLESRLERASVVLIVEVDLGPYREPRHVRAPVIGTLLRAGEDGPGEPQVYLVAPYSSVYGASAVLWHTGSGWRTLEPRHTAEDLDLTALVPVDGDFPWSPDAALMLAEELPANQIWWTRGPIEVPEAHLQTEERPTLWYPTRRQRNWFEEEAAKPTLLMQAHDARPHRRFEYFLRSPFPMLDRGYPLVDNDGLLVGITARTPSDTGAASGVISQTHLATWLTRLAAQDGDGAWRPTIREESVDVRTGQDALTPQRQRR